MSGNGPHGGPLDRTPERRDGGSSADRGQIITLEALAASMVLLGMVGFALHATAITPLTASTANQQIEEQNRVLAEDLLEGAHAEGTLQHALLHYNTSEGKFVGASLEHGGAHTTGGPPNPFGQALNETFKSHDIAFNVYVTYSVEGDRWHRVMMVDQGTPSDQAVTASKTVVLYDEMEITEAGNGKTVYEAHNDSGHQFYAAPADDDTGPAYNVVRVTVVVWKM